MALIRSVFQDELDGVSQSLVDLTEMVAVSIAKATELIRTLVDPSWKHGVESAIDLTLLGRYYERFADHAVSVSRRVYYLVTGKFA